MLLVVGGLCMSRLIINIDMKTLITEHMLEFEFEWMVNLSFCAIATLLTIDNYNLVWQVCLLFNKIDVTTDLVILSILHFIFLKQYLNQNYNHVSNSYTQSIKCSNQTAVLIRSYEAKQ